MTATLEKKGEAATAEPRTQPGRREEIDRLARLRRPGWGTVAGALAAVAVLGWSSTSSGFDGPALVDGLPHVADFVSRMFPPSWEELPVAIELMIETLGIAITGTVLGTLLSIPLALLAARNIFPQPWIRSSARTFINVFRAIPELMWALMFVASVGLGAFAGTLAITLGTSVGMARLFADIFETADMRAWDAAAATGARKSQRVAWVLLPQQIPTMASYTLLVLDGNVRAASLLGLVGAGGIGMELNQQLRLFEYGSVMTIVLVVLVVIMSLDLISSTVRKRFV
ncbi:phosphonate ABC transporter, permease protein PhnE [Demequina gelatinilytica]|uniref:phosphonate ABC transporter, permease protein PhnE n=1 Tax=Demequina gelatinilytica TaxID=1638980 RepID=UPI0009E41F32|nr:phosphonate ABC transporter, permease protein PhnE [Demequina gelatinilytica]